MKLLHIYWLNYDIINFEGIITEDKLDDFIQFYINRELNNNKVKFKVKEIKKRLGAVDILIIWDSYTVDVPPYYREYPESNSVIGFEYQIIEEKYINDFEK